METWSQHGGGGGVAGPPESDSRDYEGDAGNDAGGGGGGGGGSDVDGNAAGEEGKAGNEEKINVGGESDGEPREQEERRVSGDEGRSALQGNDSPSRRYEIFPDLILYKVFSRFFF